MHMDTLFEKVAKAAAHFENFPMRMAEWVHLLPRRPYALRIRRGPVFWVRPYSSDAAFVQSITREREYFPYFSILPGDTVVDVGANIGSFSVWVAHQEPTVRVIAYEPMPENFALFEKNIAVNHLQNLTAVRAAVAAESGTLTLYPGKGTWYGSASLAPIDAVESDRGEPVPSVSLAALFAKHGIERCDFLKMDCEGAEYSILAAVPNELWRRMNHIALEFHEFDTVHHREQLIALLTEQGFRVILPPQYQQKKIGLLFAVRVCV